MLAGIFVLTSRHLAYTMPLVKSRLETSLSKNSTACKSFVAAVNPQIGTKKLSPLLPAQLAETITMLAPQEFESHAGCALILQVAPLLLNNCQGQSI